MTDIILNNKSVSVNPLKQSAPLGAALSFLGLKGIIPLFHGSQGCTAFAKVLLVRHFRESIPLSTTAMTEVSTILGGEENIEKAILTLVEKANPEIIGLLTTGLTETRGDDMMGIIKSIRKCHPELNYLPIIFVSTPDYKGALEDGFANTVNSIVSTDYGKSSKTLDYFERPLITILAGSFLSPGDVEEIKEIVTLFGLDFIIIPDLSISLDGHLDDTFNAKTSNGTSLLKLQKLNLSLFTIAIGESMRLAAETLKTKFGKEYKIFPSLAGLKAVDEFLLLLAQISFCKNDISKLFQTQVSNLKSLIPYKYQRQRFQLQDAILDSHFYLSGKKISLALEPDLLYQTSWLLSDMGVKIFAAVTTTYSPLLNNLPIDKVTIGDLEDLENLAVGSDLIITNSQGKYLTEKLNIPLYRMGYPIFDRLGNGFRCLISYKGTINFLFQIGNIFIDLESQ